MRKYDEENATNITQKRKYIADSNGGSGCSRNSRDLTLLLAPWNWMPTEYAEQITVIAVTDYGCVGESQMGNSVVVSDCSASVGDVISAEFYAPASDKNGYYDRIYEKLAVVEP